MNPVRAILLAIPIVLVSLTVASLVSVKSLTGSEKNELTLGSIGEPKALNPITVADNAASEVMAFIFQGLIKINEELEMEPDLAERWELSQDTRAFFGSPADAAAAASKIGALPPEELARYGVESSLADGNTLKIAFSKPGQRMPNELFAALDLRPLPLGVFSVSGESGVKEALDKLGGIFGEALRDSWIGSDGSAEVVLSGVTEEVTAKLTQALEEGGATKPVVSLVASFSRLDEPMVTFYLRKDAHWHDGTPFTAADVEFTYRKLVDPAVVSPRKADFDLVKAVSIADPYTVRISYRRPFSPALISWQIGLLPKHILEGKDTKWWAENFNRSPVGTGPFRFEEWQSNAFVSIVKNPEYHEGVPHLERIIFRVIPDQMALRLAFQTRQIDFLDNVMPNAVGAFTDNPQFDLFSAPDFAYTYVGWNLRKPLFQDLRVRQALAHAVNIKEIVQYVLYGYGVQSTGIYIPQLWFFNPNVKPLEYDPGKAKALLAEAGWKPGPDGILVKDGQRFSFTLITNNGNELRKDVSALVQNAWKAQGIEVKTEAYEWAVFLKKMDDASFDACVLGWTTGIDFDQYQIWHSSQTQPGQLNFVAYKNAEADRLWDEVRAEYDKEEIKKMAGRLQQLIYGDQPYLFLYSPRDTGVMWKDAFRVLRPAKEGWKEEPVRMTRAGYKLHMHWFYRPSYKPELLKN